MNKEISADYQAIATQFGIPFDQDDIYEFAILVFKTLGQDPKTILDDKLLAEKESEALKESASSIMKHSSDTLLGVFSELTFIRLLRAVNALVKASKEERHLDHVKLAYKIICILLKSSESNCFSRENRTKMIEKVHEFLNNPRFLFQLSNYYHEKNKIQKTLGVLKILTRRLDKDFQSIQEKIKSLKSLEPSTKVSNFLIQQLEELERVYQEVPVLEAKVWAKRLENLNHQSVNEPQLYYELARYFYKKNSFETAARLFLSAVKLNNQLWDVIHDTTFPLFISLSTALITQGHFTQALNLLKQVPKISEFYSHAQNYIQFGQATDQCITQKAENHEEFMSAKDIRLFNLSFYRKARDLGNKEAISVVNQYETELNAKEWNPSFSRCLSTEFSAKGEIKDDTGCKNK